MQPLSAEIREEAVRRNDEMARDGLRVLACACRDLPQEMREYRIEDVESDLVFLGLAGMMDPPRPEVAEAVEMARGAGIKIIMVTGDYGLTAEAIAERIGITGGAHARIITGVELADLDDAGLKEVLRSEQPLVFARVAPEHKMRVVAALQSLGQIVAVTGDGVNDAPALKRADIGIAMGRAGTDVSREAAVMILLDDSFASIVHAIELGRAVYANIKKFILYLFSHNMGELMPYIFVTVAGVPMVPLTALQVLAIDLGSDVCPALALGTENPEPGLMNRPPRPSTARIFDWDLVKRFLFIGIIQGAGATARFYTRAVAWWLALGDRPAKNRPPVPARHHHDPGSDRGLSGLQRLLREDGKGLGIPGRFAVKPLPDRRGSAGGGDHGVHQLHSRPAATVRYGAAQARRLGAAHSLWRRPVCRRGTEEVDSKTDGFQEKRYFRYNRSK